MKTHLKNALLALLAFSLFVCLFVSTAFAADDNGLSAEITSTKQEYQKGDEISFNVDLKNTSTNSYSNVLLEAVPKNDGLYTGGMHNCDIQTVVPGDNEQIFISIQEEDRILKIGAVLAAVSSVLFTAFAFIVRQYYPLAAIYMIISMIFTGSSSSFADNISKLNAIRESKDLGAVTVLYDGKECEVGFRVSYQKLQESTKSETHMLGKAGKSSFIEADVTFSKNDLTGIVFAATEGNKSGYLFGIDAANKKAFLLKNTGGAYENMALKPVNVSDKQSCKLRVEYNETRVIAFLYNNPNDSEPYPLFDFEISPFGDCYGVRAFNGGFSAVKTGVAYLSSNGETYINPVALNMPDPYVLTYNGVYYCYGTNHPDNRFEVYTSSDLVNWKSGGMCALKGDIVGNGGFWAPEVYERNGKFYMLYTADEFLALAVSTSPTGPFTKTSDSYLFADYRAIDGNILFDDDGNIYLYFSKLTDGDGQQLWGCKLSGDLLSVDRTTLTHLTSPEGWEGRTNEGPFVMKHNGTYYLTYSGSGYAEATYSVGYATSDSPLGKFTKHKQNPILSMTPNAKGPGHHCFAMSPDGSEMFIVYHRHYSNTQVHPRNLCIDRAKFVKTDGKADVLSIYGPTELPQPIPSNKN